MEMLGLKNMITEIKKKKKTIDVLNSRLKGTKEEMLQNKKIYLI